MSRLHVDVTTDQRYDEANLSSSLGELMFSEFADDSYSDFEDFEDDDFEDSRDLDDWLAAELRLGRQYENES